MSHALALSHCLHLEWAEHILTDSYTSRMPHSEIEERHPCNTLIKLSKQTHFCVCKVGLHWNTFSFLFLREAKMHLRGWWWFGDWHLHEYLVVFQIIIFTKENGITTLQNFKKIYIFSLLFLCLPNLSLICHPFTLSAYQPFPRGTLLHPFPKKMASHLSVSG